MSFGKQRAERFEKDIGDAVPGPGTYDLPSTLDERGAGMDGPQRWQDPTSMSLGVQGSAEEGRPDESGFASVGHPLATSRTLEKENRAPGRLSVAKKRAQSPPGPAETASANAVREKDVKLIKQIDEVREDLNRSKREAKELRQQVAARDREVVALQRKLEESEADRRSAHQRAADMESERVDARKVVRDKEQEIGALQRKNEHLRTIAEERSKRLERKEDDSKSVLSVQEKLNALERDRKASEQTLRKDKRQLEEQVLDLQELLREERAARQKLEEREAAVTQKEGLLDAAAKAEECLKEAKVELASEWERARDLQERLDLAEDERDTAKRRLGSVERDLREEKERCEEFEQRYLELQRTGKEELDKVRAELFVDREDLHFGTGHDQEKYQLRLELEATADELQKWKDWADEQQLREIAAETQRLEELHRVRADVHRQVEDARKEVAAENRTLQKQLRELQNSQELAQAKAKVTEQAEDLEKQSKELIELEAQLSQVRQDLETAQKFGQDAEEQRRALEPRVQRAQLQAQEAEDQLAEEREKLKIREKALRIECDAALAAKAEEFSNSQASEREVAQQREASLEESLQAERKRHGECRWRSLVVAAVHSQFMVSVEATLPPLRKVAFKWRVFAHGHEQDQDRVRRQTDELERLDVELEELRGQNLELVATMQQSQCELRSALAETRRLQEREEAYERDMLQMSEQNAKLGGHANPKQKIQHLVNLKNENVSLRQDINRHKQRVKQLEAQLQSAQFFDIATGSMPAAAGELSVSSRPGGLGQPVAVERPAPGTPGRRNKTSGKVSPSVPTPDTGGDDAMGFEHLRRKTAAAESLRHARAHRRASERAVNAYQHLALLVEQLFVTQDSRAAGGVAVAGTAAGAAGFVTPNRPPTGAHGGADLPQGKLLYQRLRDMVSGANVSTSIVAPSTPQTGSTAQNARTPGSSSKEVEAEVDDDSQTKNVDAAVPSGDPPVGAAASPEPEEEAPLVA